MSVRPVKRIVQSVPTMEGAGDDEGVVCETTGNRSLVLFDRGDEVRVRAGTFIEVVR